MEERHKSLADWNIEDRNIENPVGSYGEAYNHELEAENRANNAIGGNQLGNPTMRIKSTNWEI